MGIVGPITSAVIGIGCLGLAALLGWDPSARHQTPPLAMLVWLGIINISLAVFNMIPGFPLDGGRVLRAVIWWITGNGPRATRAAARTGQVIAFLFIIIGLMRFFGGAGFGGLWLTFIGWFLLDASRSSYAQVETIEHLRGVRVADVMTREWPTIDADVNLQEFVDDHLLRSGRRCFEVQKNGEVVGLITPHEVKEIERVRWSETTVREAMRPFDRLHAVKPNTPLTEALEKMGREDINQLFVLSNRHVDGIISRGDVLRLLQTRVELAK
jgi:CBS domain-containing protein